MFIDFDSINLASIFVSFGSATLSLAALIYTIRTYLLKSGLDIRGAWVLASSITASDSYVSNLTLQNNKDRAVVIFHIYLRIGRAYYLELADHSQKPLIIQPFEAYQANYEPLIYYGINTKRIRLNKLFSDRKVKKRIVLGTSQGRYTVKDSVRKWSVLSFIFKNHANAIIDPYRYTHNGVSYGDKIQYLVIYKLSKDEYVDSLFEKSHELKYFEDLGFNQNTLKSAKNIRAKLMEARRRKLIKFDSIEIIDFKTLWKAAYDEFYSEELEGSDIGFMKYNFLARYYTWRENKRLKKKNAENTKKFKSK